MTERPAGEGKSSRTALISGLVAALAVGGLLYQRDLAAREKTKRETVESELATLKARQADSGSSNAVAATVAQPAQVPTIPGAGPAVLAMSNDTATAKPPTPAPPEKMLTRYGMSDAPRQDGLQLAGVTAEATADGTLAQLSFKPTIQDALGLVAIVVRIPVDGDGRIVSLAPGPDSKFTEVATRVSEDGKFAVYQGQAGQMKSLDFRLQVSGSAVADVRGTTGIGAMKLRVGGGTAKVE